MDSDSNRVGEDGVSPGEGKTPEGAPSAREEVIHNSNASSRPEIPGTRYDLQITLALRRIIRATDIYSRRLATEHKLTAPQLICLLAVLEDEPITATAIAKKVHLSASTVVGIVDRLERKALVVRERDSEDRRIVNVTSTPSGKVVGRSAPSPLQDRFARNFKRLPRAEQDSLARSLQRIVDLMEAVHIEAEPILETDQPEIGDGDS